MNQLQILTKKVQTFYGDLNQSISKIKSNYSQLLFPLLITAIAGQKDSLLTTTMNTIKKICLMVSQKNKEIKITHHQIAMLKWSNLLIISIKYRNTQKVTKSSFHLDVTTPIVMQLLISSRWTKSSNISTQTISITFHFNFPHQAHMLKKLIHSESEVIRFHIQWKEEISWLDHTI